MQPDAYRRLIRQQFNRAASTYADHAQPQQAAWQALQRHLPPTINGLIIDAGCGRGSGTVDLRQRYPQATVIGLDQSASMQPDVVGDIGKLPFAHGSSTLVVSHLALHWLVNPAAGMKSLWQAVAADGWLVVSVPSKGTFPEWQKLLHQAGITPPQQALPDLSDLLDYLDAQTVEHFSTWRKPYAYASWGAFRQHLKATGTHPPRHEALPIEGYQKRRLLERLQHQQGEVHVTSCFDVVVVRKSV